MALSRKDQLILDLQQQREDLTRRYRSLKQELEPRHQLQASLHKHPVRWALSTAGSAFLATRLLRGRLSASGKPRKRRGVIIGSARLLFYLARPALTTFALQKARDHLEKRLTGQSSNSMLGGPSQK